MFLQYITHGIVEILFNLPQNTFNRIHSSLWRQTQGLRDNEKVAARAVSFEVQTFICNKQKQHKRTIEHKTFFIHISGLYVPKQRLSLPDFFERFFFILLSRNKGFQPVKSLYFCVGQ